MVQIGSKKGLPSHFETQIVEEHELICLQQLHEMIKGFFEDYVLNQRGKEQIMDLLTFRHNNSMILWNSIFYFSFLDIKLPYDFLLPYKDQEFQSGLKLCNNNISISSRVGSKLDMAQQTRRNQSELPFLREKFGIR